MTKKQCRTIRKVYSKTIVFLSCGEKITLIIIFHILCEEVLKKPNQKLKFVCPAEWIFLTSGIFSLKPPPFILTCGFP